MDDNNQKPTEVPVGTEPVQIYNYTSQEAQYPVSGTITAFEVSPKRKVNKKILIGIGVGVLLAISGLAFFMIGETTNNTKTPNSSDTQSKQDTAEEETKVNDYDGIETQEKEVQVDYYTVNEGATNEVRENKTTIDGSNLEVIFTKFDYVASDGKPYIAETRQYPTNKKQACNAQNGIGVIVIGNFELECSFLFETKNGMKTFYISGFGGGSEFVYFVKGQKLIELTLFESDGLSYASDTTIISELVDAFTGSQLQ